jgi:L-seryl-tRNA(Ser) seleniumtransferase
MVVELPVQYFSQLLQQEDIPVHDHPLPLTRPKSPPPKLAAYTNPEPKAESPKPDLYPCHNRLVPPAINNALFRKLPSTDELLRSADLQPLLARDGQPAVTAAARTVLERLRQKITNHLIDKITIDLALIGLPAAIDRELRDALGYSLRPVINATGVVLHTNLGRAPLSESALDHIRDTAAVYSNLEFDLATGDRGQRDIHADRLFQQIFASIDQNSAPLATLVVNNNAAAVLLALNTLADGGEVIVSRGELVEIGGSFRIPDVMSKSHASLREVGTTNRTRVADYERAITERSRLLLRVHRSNFEISGFTEQPALDDLVALARRRNIPLMEDLGSGALLDLHAFGVAGEPGVLESLRAGVDIVSYSGDKLLGGPQCGLITGRSALIARMRSNSLFRALRVDKLTYAALEATLLAYIKRDHDSIPALHMMRLSKNQIRARAQAMQSKLFASGLTTELREGVSLIGGGAAPSATLPTTLLAITHRTRSATELSASLRNSNPPVITRIQDNHVLLDLRTVLSQQNEALIAALVALP